MYKELYIRRVNTINCAYCDKKKDKSTESIFAILLVVSQFILDSQVDEIFVYVKLFKIR